MSSLLVVSFPGRENFTLTRSTFHEFYANLVTYRQNFYHALIFLSHGNDRKIPAVDNKSGGLISIYLNSIPVDFAKTVMSELRFYLNYLAQNMKKL